MQEAVDQTGADVHLKPLMIHQDEGPSFEVDDWQVRWERWAFRVGIESGDIPLGSAVSLFMVPILTVAAVFILRDINRRAGEMS